MSCICKMATENIIGFDLSDMEKNVATFEAKFKGLSDLCDYGSCKIGVADDKTYISWWWAQGLQRRYYAEDRSKLVEFLQSSFADFFLLHTMILQALESYTAAEMVERALAMRRQVEIDMSRWRTGLVLLKQQYQKAEDVGKTIDEIADQLDRAIKRQ